MIDPAPVILAPFVLLEIEDGDPWYLSPNVWTVPGTDPVGPPGLPIAGKPAYLWARVRNRGTAPATNATVRFYWANPAVGFDRTTATRIGTSFVSLDAGQTADVLCLTPWVPTIINQGHECILAEAFHESLDPLPATPNFDVPTDRHVAQLNLSVMPSNQPVFCFSFEVHNAARVARTFSLRAQQAEVGLLKPLLPLLGRGVYLPDEPGQVARLGLVQSLCPAAAAVERVQPNVDELKLQPGERTGFSVVGILEERAALVLVTQREAHREVGGLGLLVLRP